MSGTQTVTLDGIPAGETHPIDGVPDSCPEDVLDGPRKVVPLDKTDRAVARLSAAGRSWSEIAGDLNISRSTVARRLRDPRVKQLIRVESDMRVQDILGSLAAASVSAVELLREAVEDESLPMNVRARAANDVLHNLGRFSTRTDPMTAADAREGLVLRLREYATRKVEAEALARAEAAAAAADGEVSDAIE